MSVTSDPQKMFTERSRSYIRFIRAVGYSAGLCAFFRRSSLLRDGMNVLDAGCGSGVAMLACRDAMVRRGMVPGTLNAFDLTPAMIDHFRDTLRQRDIDDIELACCDVLQLAELPAGWQDYDLLVSASMLEYVPRERFVEALTGLQNRLRPGGTFMLFMTRRNIVMHPLVGALWQSNLYSRSELQAAFDAAGFTNVRFQRFAGVLTYLNLWGYIVEAERPVG